jgi:hypothetical protein
MRSIGKRTSTLLFSTAVIAFGGFAGAAEAEPDEAATGEAESSEVAAPDAGDGDVGVAQDEFVVGYPDYGAPYGGYYGGYYPPGGTRCFATPWGIECSYGYGYSTAWNTGGWGWGW